MQRGDTEKPLSSKLRSTRYVWLMLSPIGIIMGIISAYGYADGNDYLYAMFFSLLTSVILVQYAQERWLLQSFLTGLIGGIIYALVQLLFFPSFLIFHSTWLTAFQPSFSPVFFILFLGLCVGIVDGAIIMAMVYVWRKWKILGFRK